MFNISASITKQITYNELSYDSPRVGNIITSLKSHLFRYCYNSNCSKSKTESTYNASDSQLHKLSGCRMHIKRIDIKENCQFRSRLRM